MLVFMRADPESTNKHMPYFQAKIYLGLTVFLIHSAIYFHVGTISQDNCVTVRANTPPSLTKYL